MKKIVTDTLQQTTNNLTKLAKAYAELMEKEKINLDLPFFYAYHQTNPYLKIHILKDLHPGLDLNSQQPPYFSTIHKFGEGDALLYIWDDGSNHYHSFTLAKKLPTADIPKNAKDLNIYIAKS